jgi:two-component system, OmpR family, alkaline phosphatase synthesis response regulator PhoP
MSAATILLAEDDRFLRKAAETTLKRLGYTVFGAADGEEALDVARRERPALILLDLIMPKLDGFGVLQALREDERTAHIPVMVMSNLGQESDLQLARERGANAYYVKSNLTLQELGTRVKALLEEGAK